MDRKTKQRIEDYAHDCTIGAGELAFEMPTLDSIANLPKRLGRPVSQEDMKVFVNAWKSCIQRGSQP